MRETFIFEKSIYEYVRDGPNNAGKNERTVEIPIVVRVLLHAQGTRILEVGNVLSQYGYTQPRTIVDLGDTSDAVVREDITTFSGGPFDYIVSISTLEHVGVNDVEDKPKAIAAVGACIRLLAPGGRLTFTIPVGYNQVLDAWLMYGWTGESRYMMRLTRENTWGQTERDIVCHTMYGRPFRWANAIIIGSYIKPEPDHEIRPDTGGNQADQGVQAP